MFGRNEFDDDRGVFFYFLPTVSAECLIYFSISFNRTIVISENVLLSESIASNRMTIFRANLNNTRNDHYFVLLFLQTIPQKDLICLEKFSDRLQREDFLQNTYFQTNKIVQTVLFRLEK